MKKNKRNQALAFDSTDITVQRRFREVATTFPDRTAVDYLDKHISYKELDERSDRVASFIIHHAGPENIRVAFFIETGIEQIICLLGIVKARKTYIPLDVNFPAKRNMYMLHDSEASLCITNNLNLAQARALAGDTDLLNIDDILVENTDVPHATIPEANPEDHIFIVYTSGSTGQPKGVIHTHRSIIHFVRRFSTMINIRPDDTFSFYLSISFSAHGMQILGALLNGARLCLYNLKKENFRAFTSWLNEKRITVNLVIPSILRQFLATLKKNEKIPSFRVLLIGGETLYKSDIDKVWEHVSRSCDIYNIYASSEAYLCRAYKIRPGTIIKSNIVPIGYAVEDFDIEIMDKEGNRRDPNKIGEMQIRSAFLAKGYWNKPELTSEDFTQDKDHPECMTFRSKDLAYKQSDGCIVHIGRSDSMVKLRGYRIDLGEIENLMIQNRDVKESVVVVKENQYGTKHIVAYIVPRSDKKPDINYLKIAVLRMLPSYMVPSYFVIIDELPKNEIGKTMKKDLPDPEWDKNTNGRIIDEPENPVQEELKEIFERILEILVIGIKDNIMELGADSLRLFVAFDEIEKKYGTKLNIDAIVENPTIEFIGHAIMNGNT